MSLIVALGLLLQGIVGADSRDVAVTAQGQPITVGELERDLAVVIKDRKVDATTRSELQKQVLGHAVDRRLVLHFLLSTQQGASSEDVDLVMARLQKKLDAENLKLADFLKSQGQTEAEFRAQQLWELTWQRYLDRYLTEANLQKFFEQNRREYDGTELRVAHILLPAPQSATAEDWKKIRDQAAAIRQEISAKKLTFAEAAKQHSASPTAAAGGDIGWIKRREPMPESFSAAAYKLSAGDLSLPVETAFGVHLITCLEVKPGTRPWQDAAEELRPAVIHYLFRWLADKERAKAKIEYSDHWPH